LALTPRSYVATNIECSLAPNLHFQTFGFWKRGCEDVSPQIADERKTHSSFRKPCNRAQRHCTARSTAAPSGRSRGARPTIPALRGRASGALVRVSVPMRLHPNSAPRATPGSRPRNMHGRAFLFWAGVRLPALRVHSNHEEPEHSQSFSQKAGDHVVGG
jgi:hypothetical protein